MLEVIVVIEKGNNFNTIEEADKYFADLGFKKYSSLKPDIVCEYSKRFYDGNSVKYFVHTKLWDFSDIRDKFGFGYSAEYNGQFYKKGNHEAFNITFIGWNYKSVVEFIESMFTSGLLENYEDNI